jgi:hypothetical protein
MTVLWPSWILQALLSQGTIGKVVIVCDDGGTGEFLIFLCNFFSRFLKIESAVTIFYLTYYGHSSHLTPWKVIIIRIYSYIGFLVLCSTDIVFSSVSKWRWTFVRQCTWGIVYKKRLEIQFQKGVWKGRAQVCHSSLSCSRSYHEYTWKLEWRRGYGAVVTTLWSIGQSFIRIGTLHIISNQLFCQ